MTSRPDATSPPTGLHVGAYRLLARIGEGGMGVVHLAQAPDGRRLALKVLRPHIVGDDEARRRLAREVASLRRVRSPRIAEIIDADPWGPTPYVATRYVPGLSLHEHVRQEGPLAGEDLRHFAAGLAEAVLGVHSVGVLHRDIKPSNVLLEGRSPVLIDFGLARLADDPRLTVTGWLLGTPGYLAPEILFGEDATTASDLHSWAATVAFAATGRPPFGRGPAMAIMDRVRRGEHDLTGVPSELMPVLLAALATDPAARPSLPALLADLRPQPGPRVSPADEATMPFALATPGVDDDPTDVLGTRNAESPDEAPTVAETAGDVVGRTTPLTVVQPAVRPAPASGPPPSPAPAPPAESPPPVSWRPPPGGTARMQRGLLLGGLFALVALGLAAGPYLGLAAVGIATLSLRTWSWTAEAARERTWRRGSRWYDAPLAALTSPWYLLVATGGTLMLLVWSVVLALLVGLALLLFRLPLEGSLLIMGAVLAFSLWWGPGGKRVRLPTRSLVLVATRSTAVGWVSLAVLLVGVGLCAYALLGSGTSWDPAPGPPWRQGTLLGDLLRLV
ncbi:MAG TPA: serine/threonine-protein kinase [Nocardioidaceae bacterium]|nr:serine/threonine-protein kinase [Nocardioidaceae bacterium]